MVCFNEPTAPSAAGMVRADTIAVPQAAIDQAKACLRIESDDENDLIGRLVGAAIGHAEAFLREILLAREMRQWLALGGAWQRLARAPVMAIIAVETLADDGSASALPIGTFAIDVDAYGYGWVRIVDLRIGGRLRARFTAGLASEWSGLPEPVTQGVIRLAAHLFRNRDGGDDRLPPAIATLWHPWRRIGL